MFAIPQRMDGLVWSSAGMELEVRRVMMLTGHNLGSR